MTNFSFDYGNSHWLVLDSNPYVDLTGPELDCVRSKFAELTTKRLSEVIVEDPDAGYTGPLAIQACKSGSPTNPLKNGTLPEMGGS